MKYENTVEAVFINRTNRFIAEVEIDGVRETVHVKNTGRCRELLKENAKVILEKSGNPNRKTAYDLISVYKEGLGWVNIDSQVPNRVVKDWLESGGSIFGHIDYLNPEYKFGNSRFDFYMEIEDRKILMEVKGCTLEIDGEGFFPDAPTERGVKHLNELRDAVSKGYECYAAFVIAMPVVTKVFPNTNTHPEFAQALYAAESAGVKVLHLTCDVVPDGIEINM